MKLLNVFISTGVYTCLVLFLAIYVQWDIGILNMSQWESENRYLFGVGYIIAAMYGLARRESLL